MFDWDFNVNRINNFVEVSSSVLRLSTRVTLPLLFDDRINQKLI